MGQKRDIILQTAKTLFITEGFRATGIDRIIEQSGVARMTLYNNFPSKDALIVAVLESIQTEFMDWLTEEMARRRGERVAVFFDAMAARMAMDKKPGESERGCPFSNISAEFTEEEAEARKKAQAFKQTLRDLVCGWLVEEGYDDAARLAANIVLLLDGAFVTAQIGGGGITGEDAVMQAKDMALQMLVHASKKAA